MKTPGHSCSRTRVLFLLAGVVLCSAVVAVAEAEPATTTAPATQPATAPAALPADLLAQVEALLKLNEAEKQAMLEARANPGVLAEAAFRMMLAKVASLPELGKKEFATLDRLIVPNLLRTPERYSGAPMAVKIEVYEVRKCMPDDGDIALTAPWPRNKPIWWITGRTSRPASKQIEPLIVFSTVDPTPLLGEPDAAVGPNGSRKYPNFPIVEVACVFYKLRRTRETQSGTLRDYPVVMAWQFGKGSMLSVIGQSAVDPRLLIPLLIVLVLIVAFIVVRKRTRAAPAVRGPVYQSKRFEMNAQPSADGDAPFVPRLAEDEDEGQVDPQLVEAAEQYLHEHPPETEQEHEDGKDRQG
jgi:hypothetical protein